MRETRFRWFGIYHRAVDAAVKRSDMVMAEGSIKGNGRPTLEAVVCKDLHLLDTIAYDGLTKLN